MDFNSPLVARYLRIVAIIALLLGLSDASRLLGIGSGPQGPLVELGPTGFTYLAIFSLGQLFAAVGLWIRSSWGGVLLIAATALQLGLYVFGVHDIPMNPIGFAVRLVLLVAISLIFVISLRFNRERAHD